MDPDDLMKAATAYAVSKETLGRLLGPTLDLYGEEFKQWNQELLNRRRLNVDRIFANAERKLGNRIYEDGTVSPRVLKEILDDGSYTEDALTAEYFGGVLASSRSGITRDDRGAAIAKLVGRLSVYELRTHFLVYRLAKEIFSGKIQPAQFADHQALMHIFIPHDAYRAAMEFEEQEHFDAILSHALYGLSHEGLLADFTSGSIEELRQELYRVPASGIVVTPSMRGVELYMWAHGLVHIGASEFFDPALTIVSDFQIPPIPHGARPGRMLGTEEPPPALGTK